MGNRQKGFTLIEVLITSAVLVIFIAAAAVIVQIGMESLGTARLRSEATRLAQEKLELIRNMTYEDVGTVGGIPSGNIVAVESVTVHETIFTVTTTVLYVDDAYDELAPTDLIPMDYKRVRVAVTWSGLFAARVPVKLMTDVVPQGVETAEDEGILSILVFNAQGEPVSAAEVNIQADEVTPTIDMSVMTDSNGKILIPGAPVCDACYRISVTKEGYTEDRTYSISEVANPYKPDLSVLRGQISEVSFAIDIPSSLTVKASRVSNSVYYPFVGIQFVLRGTKEIGKTSSGDSVYKVNQNIVTGTGGLTTVSDLEWDQYYLEMPTSSSVDMAGCWPLLPISLLPASTQQASVVVKTASANSLWIQALDETNQPIDSYEAEISNGNNIATKSSGLINQGDWSQVFFDSLTDDLYDLVIRSPALATVSSVIAVSGDTKEFFILATPSAEAE